LNAPHPQKEEEEKAVVDARDKTVFCVTNNV